MANSLVEVAASIAAGLGLAAACGFRVFLPLAGLSAAATVGHLPLGGSFGWLATWPALIALGTATVAEIAAYYVPWLDHALDLLAAPAAVAAGVVAAGALPVDLPPFLRWALAIIGGGGTAGLVHGATALLRLKSGATTAGAANPVVATGELASAAVLAALALLVPLAALVAVVLVLAWSVRRLFRAGRRPAEVS